MTSLDPVTSRKYEQRLRAEAAEQTRRRILDALYERLREAPSEPVSVDQVARMAGVARSTVYVIFGSRAGLFDALGADMFERAGLERLVEAVADPDARQGMRGGLRTGAQMFAVNRDVLRALHSMAQLDEEAVGGAIQRIEERRARGMIRLARRLARQKALRPDVDTKFAAHLLWVLASFDTFDALYTDRGLSVDEVGDILVATAERSLCN
jgi:AcrR family transcriptional regulator